MLRLERKNVFLVFVQLVPSLFVQGAWNGISDRKQPLLPHKTDAPYLHLQIFGFRLPWRATMSSLFRAVVSAVVIGRDLCKTHQRWSSTEGGFGILRQMLCSAR